MEKPQLRAVGKPRNVYNSLAIPLVLLLTLHPILLRFANRNVIIPRQDCLWVDLLFKVSLIQTRAFPSQLTVRPSSEIPLPMLTSTPIASKTASNHHNNTSKATKTVLTVQYPSKTINKPPVEAIKPLGRLL